MAKPTFVDLYLQARASMHPSVAFISEIAELTHRTQIAVRKWLSGENTPDYNCQELIAKHFGMPREQLFPPKNNKRDKK